MLIPEELIFEAKEKLGDRAAIIINDHFKMENFDEENLKGSCPLGIHDDSTPSFIWNGKEFCYHCFSCGNNFGIVDLYMLQGMTFLDAVDKLFKETDIKFRFGEKGVKTNREYRYPHPEQTEKIDAVKTYLGKRKISEETLRYCNVGQDEHGNIVFHYYDTNDILCNVKYRPSRKVEKGEKLPKYWTQKDADTMPLLYGMNKIDYTQPLVLCEGEIDYLSIVESGYKNVVSVPFGAGYKKTANIEKELFSWLEFNFDWLEKFPKIIVWFDNDMVGIKGRKEACSRLGSWRTWFCDVPNEMTKSDGTKIQIKDANEVLYYFGKQKVLDFINEAKEIPVQNVVDLSSVEDFDIETAPGLYSSLKGIDDIVYKFIYGSVVILTGKKGHGKSTLLNQVFVCEALNQGEDVFIFSGELSKPVLKSWIEITMLGKENIKMENGFIRKLDKSKLEEMRKWYENRIWVYDNVTSNADEILDRAVSVTRKFGAKVWILDNLMCLDLEATSDNQWQKQKEFINKLNLLAQTYGVLIVLISHPRKMGNGGLDIDRRLSADDVAGSNDLGNLAQYIISVHRYSKKEKMGEKNGKGGYKVGKEPIDYDVVVDVLKNRFTGKTDEAQLYFSYPDYRFWNTPNELGKRYKWNKDTSPLILEKLKKDETPFDKD